MMSLLVLRERLRTFYSKYDLYILAVLKFAVTLTALLLINQNLGYVPLLRNPVIAAAAALLCAFLPAGASAAAVGIYILIHLSAVSTEVLLVAGAVLVLMFLLYFSFKPGNGWLMVLTLIACYLHVPGALVLVAGLAFSPLAVIPMVFGLVLHQLGEAVLRNYSMLNAVAADANSMQKLTQVLNGLVQNQYLILFAAAIALTVLAVYIIRRLSVSYSWVVACILGILAFLVVTLTGNLVFDISVRIQDVFISAAVALVLGAAAHFMMLTVDYQGTEYVQFEDDDYYYYVKAVPKLSVSVPDVRIQKINARKIVHTQSGEGREQDRQRTEQK